MAGVIRKHLLAKQMQLVVMLKNVHGMR